MSGLPQLPENGQVGILAKDLEGGLYPDQDGVGRGGGGGGSLILYARHQRGWERVSLTIAEYLGKYGVPT